MGFSIWKDCIALEHGAEYFDLHNNFDFQGPTYNPAQRTLDLLWRRGAGDWINPTDPSELRLTFSGVRLFKVDPRDPTVPFTEDDCLQSIGFLRNDLAAEMRAYTSDQPGDGCKHLNAAFMSGFCIQVSAESVLLHVAGSA